MKSVSERFQKFLEEKKSKRAFSKLMFPGVLDSMKPKSMWIQCPENQKKEKKKKEKEFTEHKANAYVDTAP